MKTTASKTELVSAISRMEQLLCEHLTVPEGIAADVTTNAFNRRVTTHTITSLGVLTGVAVSGLRSSAVFPSSSESELCDVLSMACKRHLSFVVYRWDDASHSEEYPGVVLYPETGDVLTDFSLLAHALSEKLLLPVSVMIDPSSAYRYVDDYPKTLTDQFPGNPDGSIDTPTPAQKMVFGASRRRIPNIGNNDIPVMINDNRASYFAALSGASVSALYPAGTQRVIDEAVQLMNELTQRECSLVSTLQCNRASALLVTTPALSKQAQEAVDLLQRDQMKCGAVVLKQLSPLPDAVLRQLAKEAVIITFDTVNAGGSAGPLFSNTTSLLSDTGIRIKEARCSRRTTADDMASLVKNLEALPAGPVFLGLQFTTNKIRYPRHEVLIQEIKRQFPDIDKRSIASAIAQEAPPSKEPEIPFIIRRLADKGPEYSKSSRFFHDSILPAQKAPGELVADPFQAFPAIPPYSALLNDGSGGKLPVLDAQSCTGCLACVANCPHSALPPSAMTLSQVIETGMNAAKSNGFAFAKITPALKNLEKIAQNIIKKAETPPTSPEEILAPAFQSLADQMKMEGEKREAMQKEFDAILNGIRNLPVALTDVMYYERESREKGSGVLFSLGLNPDACTSCGLCEAICEPKALVLEEADDSMIDQGRRSFELWGHMPDTDSELITALVAGKSCHPFGAVMLNKSAFTTMVGISGSDTAEKSCAHMICAAADVAGMPGHSQIITAIEDYINKISEQVERVLYDALPGKKAAVLGETIAEINAERLPFDEVIKRIGGHEQIKQVDVKLIKRKMELVHQLQGLKWALAEGPTGMGRARYSLVLTGLQKGSWGNDHPYNPFAVPAITVESDGIDVAGGWIRGQLRHALDNIRLLRHAVLETSDKYNADQSPEYLADLSYSDLTDEEKALIPPVIIIIKPLPGNHTLNGLETLLDSDLPLKLMLIDDMAPEPTGYPERRMLQNTQLGLGTAMRYDAHFLQGVMDYDTFVQLQEIMQSKSPSVCVLMAPDPRKFKEGIDLPNLSAFAKWTRACPSIVYFPNKGKAFMQENLEINANPMHGETWCQGEIETGAGDEKTAIEYRSTWADWAWCLNAWQHHFKPAEETEEGLVTVAEYLDLNEEDRREKKPCIFRVLDGAIRSFVADGKVIGVCEAIRNTWHFWQELSGNITPFPEKLRKEVRAELQEEYDAALVAAKSDFERQLTEQETARQEALRRKLRDKLVALSLKGSAKE